MRRQLRQQVEVEARVVFRALQGRNEGFGRRLRRAGAQRGQAGIHHVHARFDGLEQHHVARAGGVVRVQDDGQVGFLLQALDKAVRLVGQQQVRHVLDADDVRAHLLDVHGELDEVILVVHGGFGVRHGDFRRAAVLLRRLDGGLHVAQVVQRVEAADDVNAVFDGLLDKEIHHVVRVGTVAQQVLAAQQHLQLGVGQRLAQLAQPLPRVFVQEAQARVVGRAAPALQRVVANLVQHFAGRQHLIGTHPGRGLRLVAVAQDGIRNLNLCHRTNFLLQFGQRRRSTPLPLTGYVSINCLLICSANH